MKRDPLSRLRIPMKPIGDSDVMPITSEATLARRSNPHSSPRRGGRGLWGSATGSSPPVSGRGLLPIIATTSLPVASPPDQPLGGGPILPEAQRVGAETRTVWLTTEHTDRSRSPVEPLPRLKLRPVDLRQIG